MPISIRQSKRGYAADNLTASLTWDESPIVGNLIVVAAFHYWKNASEDMSVTVPASVYALEKSTTDVNFEMFGRVFSRTVGAGDGDVLTVAADTTADAGTMFVAFELTGASAVDVSSAKVQSDGSTIAIPATAAVAANDSLAIGVVGRFAAAEAKGTPDYNTGETGWVELNRWQYSSTDIEAYVATKTVAASATPAMTLTPGAATARDMAGFVLVVTPGNSPPMLSVPGAQTGKYDVTKTISSITPTAGTGTIDQVDLTCTAGMTITVSPSGAAGVTGNGTAAVQVTGTQTDVLATVASIDVDRADPGQSVWFTNDLVTIVVTDDLDETATDSIAVQWTPSAGVGTANVRLTGTSAQVLDAISKLGWTPTTAGAASLFMHSETSTPLSDEDTFNFTVSAAGGGGSELGEWLRRRRRR